MNHRAIYDQCRENPNYTLCLNANMMSADFQAAYNELLFWNTNIKTIINESSLRVYKINSNEENFMEILRQKVITDGIQNLRLKCFYHGPSFQNQGNVCQFDIQLSRCREHNEPLVLSKEPFYTNMSDIGTQHNIQPFSYVLWGKVFVDAEYKRDPEDSTDLEQYFLDFDLINDYGNKKYILRNEENFFPAYIIFYERNRNPRINNPMIEMALPVPVEVQYQNVLLDEESLNEVFQCSEHHRDIQVVSVQKIINPILEQIFNEVKDHYGPPEEVGVLRVFHGLPFERADAVARSNLSWRKSLYGKYGWGVHFGQHPHNAKYYPYKYPSGPSNKRCMFAFDMLIKNSIQFGFEEINNMHATPEGYDTVEILRTRAYIKFQDNEFIPRYKIIYYDNFGNN